MNQFQLLRKYRIRPRRSLGQHFLVDDNLQRKLVAAVAPLDRDTILEIGAGLGALTEHLAASGARVVAIERDAHLAAILEQEFGERFPRLSIRPSDILEYPLRTLTRARRIKVVGNLPYYLTTPIIFFLIEQRAILTNAVLTMQREVANRILAQPGSPDYGRLSVAVRYAADVGRLFDVSRHAFRPEPAVDSTVVRLQFNHRSVPGCDEHLFGGVVKAAFSQRRKQLINTLSRVGTCDIPRATLADILQRVGIDPAARAEELLLKDFVNLAIALRRAMVPLPTVDAVPLCVGSTSS